ncbi:hypothetical protein BDV96DRAFT_601978 [Lophiotrema nucula]|uniref:Uncharacterized protein n=1 Tax=Lophiotrema nucula TaxID=690887 RepID=A0A6A5YZG1_9PLEO|nr:hypothetical protein BDV96DRAFT_601978 [Lophiotrema nucula]
MKRKFSFNLAPVKVVHPKSDAHSKHTPEPTPSQTQSYRHHQSKDSLSSLNPPFVNRRPLSPRTEQELRAACALILQDFKPSDHVFTEEAKRIAEYNTRKSARSEPAQVQVRRPTGAPAEPRSTQDARRQSHKSGPSLKSYPDLPITANTGRRRAENTEEAEHASRRTVKSPISDPPRSATIRNEMASDDEYSVRTPQTGSTDSHFRSSSTAPTSAALASSKSSTRGSHQFDSAAAVADAHAAEWMRLEMEKRRAQMASQPQSEQKSAARPPSRSRSIRSEIKEYIFPSSSDRLSRQESRDSIRSRASSQDEPKRSGSAHGWRSWGLQRRSSSRSNSRPGTSKGRIETHEQEKKSELNLNRELPPLPSLDSWNQHEQSPSKEKRKSTAQGAHIATLMRSQDQHQQDYAATVRKQHRRSGSDTLALRYANTSFNKSEPQVARTASQMKVKAQVVHAPTRQKLESSMDFDELMSAMESPRGFHDQLQLKLGGHTHQHNGTSLSRSPSAKMSSDNPRLNAPNFSRKISTDVSGHRPIPEHDDLGYENIVQITPYESKAAGKEEQKGKLRKVLSGWVLRKEKKENWMRDFERNGIKNGVMIQDEPALPPVIRY